MMASRRRGRPARRPVKGSPPPSGRRGRHQLQRHLTWVAGLERVRSESVSNGVGLRVVGCLPRRVDPCCVGLLAQRLKQTRSDKSLINHGQRVAGTSFRRVDPRCAGPLAQRLKNVTPTQLFPSTEDPHKHWISLSLSSRFTVTSTVKKRTLLPAQEMDSV